MAHPMPEINTIIKQLRLSHIIDHLPQRNRESIEKKLAYPEFLALVLQDEMLGRDNKKLLARIKRANIRSDKSQNKSFANTRAYFLPVY
jgi:DNA replication protein DnaC